MVRLIASNADHPRRARSRQSSKRRTALLAVKRPTRDDVFDLTARHADIH